MDQEQPATPDQGSERMPRWIPRLLLLGVLVAFGAAVAWHVLGKLVGLLEMLALALFLSFALEPAVKWLADRGWRRGAATGAVLAAAILAGIALLALMIPVIVRQTESILATLPTWIDSVAATLKRCCGVDVSTTTAIAQAQGAHSQLAGYAANFAGNLLGFGAAVITGVFKAFATGLFLFYFVAEGPRFRRAVCSLLKPEPQRRVLRAWEIAIEKTGGYFYSRLLLAVVNGSLTFVVLWLLGVPFAFPLAVFVGVVSEFIPMVGTYIASIIPLFVALVSVSLLATILLLAWFVAYQQLENYLLGPRITAHTMQLHPAVAFAAAIAGASLGGLLWAFLALPVAATLQAATSEYLTHHEVVSTGLTQGPSEDRPARKRRPGRQWWTRSKQTGDF